MIIEKDGQIIVTELRPMSEAPKPTNQKRFSEYFLLFVDAEGQIKTYLAFTDTDNDFFGWFGVFENTNFVGWLPVPIYQPEPKCEKCGVTSAKHAVQICSVDPGSDEACPGSVLWG